MRRALIGAWLALPLVLAPAAAADTDSDYAARLHTVGIYGQKDYNAWLAKITCKRLSTGLDADASESATFLTMNLPQASTEQVWQFLGIALQMYCPNHLGALT